MKRTWDLIKNGYVNVNTKHTTEKISIKWLILIIGAIIVYNYYLI
mgnify:CR=1 FL=1